jgi:hypothetical protein
VRLEPASAIRGAWYFGRAAGVGGEEAVVRRDVTARLRLKPIRGQEEVAEIEILGRPAAAEELGFVLSDEGALRHDRTLFESLDSLLSEPALKNILTHVGNDHAVYMSQRRALDEYAHRGRLEGSHFTDALLDKKHVSLVERVESLLLFFARHFFVFPREKHGPGLQVALRPDWSADRGSPSPGDEARYDALARELAEKIDDILKAYGDYRGTVRDSLHA